MWFFCCVFNGGFTFSENCSHHNIDRCTNGCNIHINMASNQFFGISRDITAEMGKAVAAIVAVIAVIYVGVSIATRNLDKTIDLKLNEKMKKKVAV